MFIIFMPPELPNSARLVINIRLVEGNKKGMGVSTIRLSQSFRPSHCPCIKDKQRSQPTPSDYIYKLATSIRYSHSWDIIHPRRRLSLHYLCDTVSKLRSLKNTE